MKNAIGSYGIFLVNFGGFFFWLESAGSCSSREKIIRSL